MTRKNQHRQQLQWQRRKKILKFNEKIYKIFQSSQMTRMIFSKIEMATPKKRFKI